MGDIQFKIDQSAIRAAIAEEIKRLDSNGMQASQQILLEGVAAAQGMCRKDTGALKDSIAEASSVTRIAPCQFAITLANGVEYGAAQETGPIDSEKTWGFSPHIRPGGMVMMVKSEECIDRVFGD
ncbi:hypothetical protein M0R72_06825 [Candidatus Pacearchaeota archaeon]|jgi:hypothetical protein|nr:hypothetical protein [Candidatus Pacearchaeota archaeon]